MSSVTKRTIDLVVSTIALVALSPVLVAIAAAVRIRLGRPVLFIQERPGLGERPFRIYKFRTMRETRDAEGNLLPDADRLDPLGRFLRTTSLDELPELVNVAKGDMSLVGPRPLLVEYLPWYDARQRSRHDVRPGITGLTQVHGRNALSWSEKLELDTRYVDEWSLGLDLRLLARTVEAVVRAQGIHAEGHATMPRFDVMRSNEGGVGPTTQRPGD